MLLRTGESGRRAALSSRRCGGARGSEDPLGTQDFAVGGGLDVEDLAALEVPLVVVIVEVADDVVVAGTHDKAANDQGLAVGQREAVAVAAQAEDGHVLLDGLGVEREPLEEPRAVVEGLGAFLELHGHLEASQGNLAWADYEGIKRHPAVKDFQKVCVTNQFFNGQAQENAKLNNVQLVDQHLLGELLQQNPTTMLEVEQLLYTQWDAGTDE